MPGRFGPVPLAQLKDIQEQDLSWETLLLVMDELKRPQSEHQAPQVALHRFFVEYRDLGVAAARPWHVAFEDEPFLPMLFREKHRLFSTWHSDINRLVNEAFERVSLADTSEAAMKEGWRKAMHEFLPKALWQGPAWGKYPERKKEPTQDISVKTQRVGAKVQSESELQRVPSFLAGGSGDVTTTHSYCSFRAKVVSDLLTMQMEHLDVRPKKLLKSGQDMFGRHGRGIFIFHYRSAADVWALRPVRCDHNVPAESRYSNVLWYMTLDQNARSQTFKEGAVDLILHYDPSVVVLVGCAAWFLEGGEDFVTQWCQIGGKDYASQLDRCSKSYHPGALAKAAPNLAGALLEDSDYQKKTVDNLREQFLLQELRNQNNHKKTPQEFGEHSANLFLPKELPSLAPPEFQQRLIDLRRELVRKLEDHCKAVREDNDPLRRQYIKHQAAFSTFAGNSRKELANGFIAELAPIVASLGILDVGAEAFGSEENYAAAIRQCRSSHVAEHDKMQQAIDEKIQCITASARGASESCRVCNNHDARGKVLTCLGCKQVFYCSRECQKADWKRRHKDECTR